MSEMIAVFIIAICSVGSAIGVFVSVLLLVDVRARLKKRDVARTEFHRNVGRRVDTIERHLVMKTRNEYPGFQIADSKSQISEPWTAKSYGGSA